MKKFIILIVVFSMLCLYSCKADKTDVGLECADTYTIEYDLTNIEDVVTDIFIAKIISATPIADVEFENVSNDFATPVLYTAKVEQAIWSFSVTPGTTIQIVRYVKDRDDGVYWAEGYELNETYLISGDVQPLKQKPVIVDMGLMTSKIESDGELIPISNKSADILKNIKTISDFNSNKAVAELKTKDLADIPDAFLKFKQNSDDSKNETLLQTIKQSINIDSNVYLEKYDNAE